jgi:NSS family neurotransmitter:Na+ symporter
LFSWLLVYFIVCDGVEKVGKIVSWTVPLPLILVLIILIKGLLQNGAFLGIKHYLNPNFEVLTDSKVWLAAYSQIFYSLSIGFGILIAYASYLPKKQAEISNSAFITSFANCFTSYFVGFAVFSIIGYLSLKNGTDISHTVKSGPGLAFVVFPAALSKLPGAPFFSVLFFITLLSLGIDSAFSIVEAIISAIDDKFDNKVSRKKITLFVCLIGFILGFIFISRSGLYWLDIVDHWMNNYGLAVVGVFECIVIGYLVDIKLFRKKINEHSDFSLNGIWDFCIKYVTPIILCYLIGSSIISEVTNPYSGYPRNILNIGGWAVILTTIIIALFLMENKNKWLYKIIIIFFTLVIALIAMNKQELGMFIFGTAFLLGGLIFFIKISYKKSKL